LWDRAFAEIGNQKRGFDFKDSPFGKCWVDIYPFGSKEINYEHVFTGFIFVTPNDKLNFNSYYPYCEYGAEQEFYSKNSKTELDSLNFKNVIADFKYNKFIDETSWYMFEARFNFIPFIFYFLFLSIGILITLFHFIRTLIKY